MGSVWKVELREGDCFRGRGQVWTVGIGRGRTRLRKPVWEEG